MDITLPQDLTVIIPYATVLNVGYIHGCPDISYTCTSFRVSFKVHVISKAHCPPIIGNKLLGKIIAADMAMYEITSRSSTEVEYTVCIPHVNKRRNKTIFLVINSRYIINTLNGLPYIFRIICLTAHKLKCTSTLRHIITIRSWLVINAIILVCKRDICSTIPGPLTECSICWARDTVKFVGSYAFPRLRVNATWSVGIKPACNVTLRGSRYVNDNHISLGSP